MKKIILLFILVCGVLFTANLVYTEANPFYTLACKTSKKIAILVNNDLRSEGTRSTIITKFTAYFKKARTAAGSNFENLKDGECSWMDRGMEGGETPCLTFTMTSPEYYTPKLVAINSNGTFSGRISWVLPIRQIDDFTKLNRTDGTRFTVKARRAGGCLDIGSREGFPDIGFR